MVIVSAAAAVCSGNDLTASYLGLAWLGCYAELCQCDPIIIAIISIKIDQKSMINYKQEFKQY